VLCDAATGAEKCYLPDGGGFVYFSPDGATVLTRTDNGAKLWTATGRLLFRLSHGAWVNCAAYSPDGRTVVTGCMDATVRLWDTATGKLIRSLPGRPGPGFAGGIQCVKFSADGQILASSDPAVSFWDAATGTKIGELQTPGGLQVYAMDFSPDGETLATASFGAVHLWDVETRTETRDWIDTALFDSISYSPNGRVLYVSSADTVELRDAETGARIASLSGHAAQVGSVALSADGLTLAVGYWDGTVRLWDTAARSQTRDLQGGGGISAALSPSGKVLATAAVGDGVWLWDVTKMREICTTHVPPGEPTSEGYSAAFSSDGRLLVVGVGGGCTLWDTDFMMFARSFRGGENYTCSVAISPNNRIVAAGDTNWTVTLWDTASGTVLRTLALDPAEYSSGDVSAVAFSPDGTLLAAAAGSGVFIWDARTGDRVRAWTEAATSAAFSPDGNILGIGFQDGTIRLWNAATWHEASIFRAGTIPTSISFSSDGSLLASGSTDGTILLWNVGN
jgi:WD40 repeat protein